jgi:hypothetical protein
MLDKKKLRGFLPFNRLVRDIPASPDIIFFNAQTAIFRGNFLGFDKALITAPIGKSSSNLFYSHEVFSSLPIYKFEQIEFSLGGTK